MLILVNRLSALRFSELMHVYHEANVENGRICYPSLSQARQEDAAEQDFYQYLNEVFFRQKDSVYALWQVQGRYTAALRLEPYCDGHLLCALETAPELRQKGYATALVCNVIRHLSAQGCGVLYSHVSKSNTASLRTHLKCGFIVVADYARYTDGSVLQNCYTLRYEYEKTEGI